MHIIPVIDLRGAQAVRAVAGRREQYRPLSTPLCASAEPAAVVAAYRTVFPFRTFYLADLDAIMGAGDNAASVAALCRRYPDCGWWLDAGFSEPDEFAALPSSLRPVLGSESLRDLGHYRTLRAAAELRGLQPLLSLDSQHGRPLGPPELSRQARLWPRDVIVMQLDRVGVDAGPELRRPATADDSTRFRFYAAGGVRDGEDLKRLQSAGYYGALVASALHEGRLDAALFEQ